MNRKSILILFSPILFIVTSSLTLYGQCSSQVLHLAGTETINGVDVTVTSAGVTDSILNYCPWLTRPYLIGASFSGGSGNGSFTFQFSPPIDSVTLNFSGINDQFINKEIVKLLVNGNHYSIPSAGLPNGCDSLAVLTPFGNITGHASGGVSGWMGTTIIGNISEITVLDSIVAGSPGGSVFSIFFCQETSNPCGAGIACLDAIQGIIDICVEVGNNPSIPLSTIDCDGDGVTNADECMDLTDPLDRCDYDSTSITLPVIADQSGCPQPCPDLTPTTTLIPSTIAGNSAIEVAIELSEVNGIDTDGSVISVRVPSDPRLQFVWNIGLTQAAGIPVQNADWNYLGNNGVIHNWTYNGNGLIIKGNSTAALGFQAFYDPQSTDGQTTFTSTVVPFSGGDCNLFNNTDSEQLVYFQ